jgi:hypothetical protein
MDVEIGPHLYRNTDGTVEIEGVPQITFFVPRSGGPVLLNFVVFDAVGKIILKVVDSTFAFNERRAYELTKTPTSLTITLPETKQVVLQVEFKDGGRVAMRKADFLTLRAHRLEVLPTEWRLEQTRVTAGETDLQGKPVVIG